MNNFDYTGYGPTSAGRAPSAAELRRAKYNRYHSSRGIQAMQYIDPATVAAAERMVQLGMGNDKSPQAVRRTLHGTAAGQATLDAAFAARSAGLLGYGDPRQYSANITQMISGGFQQSIRGGALDGNPGRMQGFNQRVSGNGVIAERAAITMQKKLLDNLYGEGQQADPNRLSGYDMTEASQVAARIVGRRGMGNLMHLEKNADFATRMGAAMQSEVDPNVRAGLSALTDEQRDKMANAEVSGDSSELPRVIEEIAATMNDPKAREAFKNIANSNHALVFNEKNAKSLADTVKEVTKGMAALNDIYGDLSSDDAHAMLEQIHGGRITNKQQARAAARTVDEMRNAAEYAGMDPKQVMGLFAKLQSHGQQVGSELGMDERSQRHSEALGSKLAAYVAPRATVAAKGIAEASRTLGLEGDGPTAEEIAADAQKMQLEAADMYKGYLYSLSDMSGASKEQKAQIDKFAADYRAARDKGDATGMYIAEQNIRGTFKDFDREINQGAYSADAGVGMERAQSSGELAKSADALVAKHSSMVNPLTDAGLSEEDAVAMNRITINKLAGIRGLAKFSEIAKVEDPQDRENLLKQFGENYNLTDTERELMSRTFMDEKGMLREDLMKRYGLVTRETVKSAGLGSEGDSSLMAEISLANLDKNEKRQRMTDKDNKISIRGIAQGMLRGDVENPLAEADTAAAALDALKSAGVPLMVDDEEEYTKDDGTKGTRKVKRDLTELYQSGIKLDNLDDEALKRIDKAAGKDVNLVDRVNKKLGTNMTREEFIEKSKTDKRLQDTAYLQLRDAGAEMEFSVGGGRDNISVVNDKVQGLGGKISDRFQKLKTLESISGFVGEEEMKDLTTDILQGNEVNVGDLINADEYDKVKSKDGKGYAALFKNSGKFQAIADITKTGDKRQIADVAGMLGDKGLAEFEKQIAEMESALASGDFDPVNGKMVDDQGVERALTEQSINEMKVALADLRQKAEEDKGVQTIGTMTVTKLEVTGDFNSSKK